MKKETCYRWYGVSHDFGQWKISEKGELKVEGIIIGFWLKQERTCTRCGYVEVELTKEM